MTDAVAPVTRTMWRAVGRQLESLGGRLVFVVCMTLAVTAGTTLAVAVWLWSQGTERLQRANFVEEVEDIHDHLVHDRIDFDRRLRQFRFRHYALQPYPWPDGQAEVGALRDVVASRFGPGSDPHVVRVDERTRCIQPPWLHRHEHQPEFDCWYVRFTLPPDHAYAFEIDRNAHRSFDLSVFAPVYLGVIGIESVLLAIVISRLTLAPLRRLSEASQSFARSIPRCCRKPGRARSAWCYARST